MNTNTAEILTHEPGDILVQNLQLLMHKHRVSEAELARRTNIPQPTLHKILTGKTADPRISTLHQLASYFELSLDALYSPFAQQDKQASTEGVSIPVISWSDCTKTNNPTTGLTVNNWDNWVIIDTNQHANSYALNSRPCMEPFFPRGTVLIVDPHTKPNDGDLIIVQYAETQHATLRELCIDGPNQLLLMPYKDAEPETLTKTIRVLGTVVQSRFNY